MAAPTLPLLEAALAYAARGWHVFPCHTPTKTGCDCSKRRDCTDVGKHPWPQHGLSEATTDEATIRQWWKRYPRANIGIRTGAISGLVVLDVDFRKGGAESLAELEQSYSVVPETVQQLTGNGQHYVLAHPGVSVQNSTEKMAPGLDIRGDGGYVIAAPSLHANGKRYTWEVLHEPDETPLAPMPDWLLALVAEKPRPPAPPPTGAHEAPSAAYASELLRFVPNPAADRTTWRNIGMALHSTGADWAYSLWDMWSQQYPDKYEASGQTKAWNSFSLEGPQGKDPITFGTLVHLARQGGYQQRNGQTPGPEDPRPVVKIGPDITRMVDAGQDALLHLPDGPVLFQRARRISIIARGVKPPKWLNRAVHAPVIVEATAAYLDELATLAARWEKFDKRSKEWFDVTPPARFTQTLLGRPSSPFPVLEGIICCPTLRPDGSLLTTPGYDASTGLYLDSNGTQFPAIPDQPTFDDARSALGRLQEVFIDFPFAAREEGTTTNPYCSAAIAALLTLVSRFTIQGNVPLFGVTATAAGSGKGKLVDAIALTATGRAAPKMGQTLDENEEQKRLLALALEGANVCCLDNVTHPLGNQHLDLAMTSGTVYGRILGQTGMAQAPWQAVMFATGNNLHYRGDMARRVVPIVLDPKMEKPEERTGFRHPELEGWVCQQRQTLVVASLTIVRAFFLAGCPSQGLTPYGSFEAWSNLIRSTVVWLGEADPCEGRKDLTAQTDETYERLAALLDTWEACYPLRTNGQPQERTINQVKQDIATFAATNNATANAWDELQGALATFDKRSDGKSLNTHAIGNGLRHVEGRVIGGKRLKRHGEYKHNALWRVETV